MIAAFPLTQIIPKNLLIWADKEKIRRLLINILDNAIKYNIEHGTISLEIHQKNQSCCLIISNTFPRIPQEELSKVFEQFYRLEKSRSTQHGGTGLGLAITKEIVRLHGGQISMESGPGDWVQVKTLLPIQSQLHTA